MVFVTGATGFLGSYLCLYLCERGYQIKASKRAHSNIPEFLKQYQNQITWVEVDLLDFFELKDAMEGCDTLFHCAAIVSFREDKNKTLWKTNVDISNNIVNVCLELGNIYLIHFSSIAAIGDAKPNSLIDENCRWVYKNHSSDYSITKFEGERAVWRGIHEGLDALIINPSVILGFDSRGKGSMNLIKQVQNDLLFYADGATGFVDVNDVVKCTLELVDKKVVGERFIISNENLTFKTILEIIAKALNKKAPHIRIKPRLMKFAAFIIQLISSKHPLNKFTARAAVTKSEYSNAKLLKYINYGFMPIQTSIDNMVNKKLL